MEKTKRTLMIVSLSALAIACVMLILAVFKVKIFQGVPLRVLLVLSTVAVASGLSISEISVVKRKRILGFVGLALLTVSVLMALVIFCSPLLENGSVFNTITAIISLFSVLFVIIISLYSKLGKSMLGLQIPTYISLVVLDVIISLLIAGVKIFSINGVLQTFIVLIIVCVGLLIASWVISSKKKSTETSPVHDKTITISIEEYENLKQENKLLRQELEKTKSSKNEN